jgi:serine/threonine protein kinase
MAPEQARDTRQVIGASDVFSLGSTLLYAGSGHAPYRGESVIDILVQLTTHAPDLSGLAPELTDLVAACLDRDPQHRPTPAMLLAELAPYVDLGAEHDLEPSVLPAAGLALIQEYRQRPQPQPPPPDDESTGPETTFASQPGSLPSDAVISTAAQLGSAVALLPDGVATPSGRRWRAAPVWRSRPAGPPGVRGSRAGGDRPPAAGDQRPGRVSSIVVPVGAVVALLTLGSIVGILVHSSTNPVQNSPNISNGYNPRPPGPQPPLSGADDRPGGQPELLVNQPLGDGVTGFVLHGRGWLPGQLITIALAGGKRSNYRQTVDMAGTFNYTINQSREFFAGSIPEGHYTAVATATDGSTAEASFEVHP